MGKVTNSKYIQGIVFSLTKPSKEKILLKLNKFGFYQNPADLEGGKYPVPGPL